MVCHILFKTCCQILDKTCVALVPICHTLHNMTQNFHHDWNPAMFSYFASAIVFTAGDQNYLQTLPYSPNIWQRPILSENKLGLSCTKIGIWSNWIGLVHQSAELFVELFVQTSKELRKPQRPTALHVTTRVFKRYNDLRSTSQSTKWVEQIRFLRHQNPTWNTWDKNFECGTAQPS